MRALIAMVMLLGAAPAPAATAAETAAKRQQAMIDQVALLVLTGKPGEALPIAETLIAEGEAQAAAEKRRVYSGQTLSMVMSNMLSAAAEHVGAVDIGPYYGRALFFKGFALINLGRTPEAGAFLDRAVAVSPADSQFLCEDASWHARNGDTTGGLALYQRCEAENGNMPEGARLRLKAVSLRGQGYVLIDLDRLDEAEAKYRASLAIEPDNAIALGDLQVIAQRKAAAARARRTS